MSPDVLRWAAPIITGLLCIAIPGIVRAAIVGQFAEAREQERIRMAQHNENENAHPNLASISHAEARFERAFSDFRAEIMRELSALGRQLEELREQINAAGKAAKRRSKVK